ncbi:MAG: LLM class F420-dependent oxidoreductase [Gammaproteobacteria bacterium]|nr:LLM class F420-dependent oxidoreductase [Gammaproteobacteria bacterium]MYH16667.1 LLM class F420-dependent oxidoreductase [Gammaproteobacteria bacterium]MYK84353.1 LLM class F420-dependent oxidoreductase [Gammaproteobacteria bacterium]
MRYGYVVPNNFGVADPNELIRLGVRAEALGFDSLWVNHHVLNVGYVRDRLGELPYHDALVMLTWLAAKTSRVTLGTSVLVMPYLHPMSLAKQLATLDHLSGGRLVVGLGVGSLPEENAALGVPYESRGAFCNEFLEVLRLLWTESGASFAGQHFSFTDLISSPKPLQKPHPPIVIGGNRPPALRRAARFGDGWHPMNCSPDGVRQRLQALRAEAAAVNRPEIPTMVQVRLDMKRVTPESAAEYADAGVTDLVMSLNSGDVQRNEDALEAFAAAMF